MLTFNPGPSKISKAVSADICESARNGVLELSHRSASFSEISAAAISGLREFLRVPSEYEILYLDSATSGWHSIVANGVEAHSFHFINGAFSEKSLRAAELLGKTARFQKVDWGESNNFSVKIPDQTEWIFACVNETSTGVFVPENELRALRKNNPNTFLALDLTSIAGAVEFDFSLADAAYFSVQKAFGLPAGLGILVLSPRAIAKSVQLADAGKNLAGLWQWPKMLTPMKTKNHQTIQTPNVLNIYLLSRQCARWNAGGGLAAISAKTQEKSSFLSDLVAAHSDLDFFVKSPPHRSPSVFTISAAPEKIIKIHDFARAQNIVLGKGYGRTKENVFRVANFPSILMEDLEGLGRVLNQI